MKFNENVNKIIHNCNVQSMKSIEILRKNSTYLDFTNEEEILNILKCLDVKKGR